MPPEIAAEYLTQLSLPYFLRRKTVPAIRGLRAAEQAARRARSRQLRANILNNLGVSYAQALDGTAPARLFNGLSDSSRHLGT